MPIGTPFHPRTSALCESMSWRDWAGYFAVSAYEVHHEREYNAIRNAAALIDVSPLFKYRVAGRNAAALVDRIVTRDARKMAVGQVAYTHWCDGEGKIIDDGTISRLDENLYRWTAAEPTLRWIRMNSAGLEVEIEDVSDRIAALALQGPTSRAILAACAGPGVERLKYFRVMPTAIAGIPVEVSRTGYTGDLGYEIWVEARKALIPSQKYSPYEIGLGRLVHLDKAPFVGQAALRREKERGPQRRLVGLEIAWDDIERLHAEAGLAPQLAATASRVAVPLYRGDEQVGRATSTTWSPTLKKMIALASVRSEHADLGSLLDFELTVEHQRRRAHATVVPLPFFDPPRKRASGGS